MSLSVRMRTSMGGTAVFAALLFLAGRADAQHLPPLRAGFPKLYAGAGTVRASAPAVGDLFNDGRKEIVFGTAGRKIYVLFPDGSVAPGWPVTMPSEPGAAPAIGDVDGDGFPDIVVACGSTFDPNGAGEVRAYKRDGTLIWSFLPADNNGDGRPDGVVSTPAIGDIDGDGKNEVVFGSWDFNLYALRGATGALMPGFPPDPSGLGFGLRDSIWSSPALADLDGDGKLEIIIGSDTHAEGPPINTPDGGAIRVFRWNGTYYPGFPQYVDQTIMSSPAIGDIDGDGKLEIIVGGGVFYTGAVGHKVYAWKTDGTFVPGWPVTTAGQVFSSPALADLDGDGIPEVIISDQPEGGQEPWLYAFRGSGALLWKMRPRCFFATTPNIGNPVVADVNGDGQVEILVPVNTEIAIVSRTGAQLTSPGPPSAGDPRLSYYTNTAISGSAVVADLDGDGVVNIVAGSGEPFPSPTDAAIYVWRDPAIHVGPSPWPMFRKDARRRGFFGPASVPPTAGPFRFYTVAPCRIFDTRTSGLPLQAGELRPFTIAGRCGVPFGARAVADNMTVTQGGSFGDLRLFPFGSPEPPTSAINFRAMLTRANNAITVLSPIGDIGIQCDMPATSVHVIFDVVGYFQ